MCWVKHEKGACGRNLRNNLPIYIYLELNKMFQLNLKFTICGHLAIWC